uniref:Amino acid permease domain-containing protein n=1 Tax=Spironucleus salmonicida TaxID=348837 RepID=V6LXZ0_9EUKA|eukprot:EST49512.1 Amino acid permease domain-containing protein [Spironucleus salmonicida]
MLYKIYHNLDKLSLFIISLQQIFSLYQQQRLNIQLNIYISLQQSILKIIIIVKALVYSIKQKPQIQRYLKMHQLLSFLNLNVLYQSLQKNKRFYKKYVFVNFKNNNGKHQYKLKSQPNLVKLFITTDEKLTYYQEISLLKQQTVKQNVRLYQSNKIYQINNVVYFDNIQYLY